MYMQEAACVHMQLACMEATCHSLMEATHTRIYKVLKFTVIVGVYSLSLRAALKLSKRFFLVDYEEEGTREVLKEEELEGKLLEGETIIVTKYKDNYRAKILMIGKYYNIE